MGVTSEASAGGCPRVPGRRSGNGTRPRAFLGDSNGGMACGVCRLTHQLGHRAVCFPCGQGRHVLHARCVVEALARSAAPAPLRCPTVNCGAQHPRSRTRSPTLEVGRARGSGPRKSGSPQSGSADGGATIGDEDVRSRGLWCGWDQKSLGIGPLLDAVWSEDLRQRFATGKKV